MASEGQNRFREWINEGAGRWVTIVVCLVVLAGAVAGSVHLLRTHKNRGEQSVKNAGRRVEVFCRSCRKGGTTRVAFYADEVTWPVECPLCKQQQAYPGIRCRNCGNITERPENTGVFPCTHCGAVIDLRGPSGGPTPPKL